MIINYSHLTQFPLCIAYKYSCPPNETRTQNNSIQENILKVFTSVFLTLEKTPQQNNFPITFLSLQKSQRSLAGFVYYKISIKLQY